jgi:hypothetical protein
VEGRNGGRLAGYAREDTRLRALLDAQIETFAGATGVVMASENSKTALIFDGE